MRCDQYQGLNKRARNLVKGIIKGATESSTITYPDGRTETYSSDRVSVCAKVEIIGYVRGAYVQRAGNRHRYTLRDGRVFEEFVEHIIHCGGPNYFIALRDVATGEVVAASRWKDEELKRYAG